MPCEEGWRWSCHVCASWAEMRLGCHACVSWVERHLGCCACASLVVMHLGCLVAATWAAMHPGCHASVFLEGTCLGCHASASSCVAGRHPAALRCCRSSPHHRLRSSLEPPVQPAPARAQTLCLCALSVSSSCHCRHTSLTSVKNHHQDKALQCTKRLCEGQPGERTGTLPVRMHRVPGLREPTLSMSFLASSASPGLAITGPSAQVDQRCQLQHGHKRGRVLGCSKEAFAVKPASGR